MKILRFWVSKFLRFKKNVVFDLLTADYLQSSVVFENIADNLRIFYYILINSVIFAISRN